MSELQHYAQAGAWCLLIGAEVIVALCMLAIVVKVVRAVINDA